MSFHDIPTGADQAPDPQQAMDGMLADFARQNPSLAWLPQMLAMRRQAVVESSSPSGLDDSEERIEALEAALAQSEARTARYAAACERLAARLEAARERLADAAASFGACGLCWGEEPRCRSCRGRGKPGWFAADTAQRDRYFAEAIMDDPAPGPTPVHQS
jgi:hypothetical protein